MKWHPDKNKSLPATEKFQEINEAYSILSNPQEKTWYDRHRETIVRNWNLNVHSPQKEDEKPEGSNALTLGGNFFPYYTRPAFLGYDDSENGFYTVYRNVFSIIKAGVEEMSDLVNEFENEDNETKVNILIQKAPGFGNAETMLIDVARFYRYWEELILLIDVAWKELCYSNLLRSGELIPKEDQEAREILRKNYMGIITNLLQYVKLIDPRYHKYVHSMLQNQQGEKNKKENNFSSPLKPLLDSPKKEKMDIVESKEIALQENNRLKPEDLCMECWNWAVANLERIINTQSIDVNLSHNSFNQPILGGALPLEYNQQDINDEKQLVIKNNEDMNKIEMEDEDISEKSGNKTLRNKLLGLPESQ